MSTGAQIAMSAVIGGTAEKAGRRQTCPTRQGRICQRRRYRGVCDDV